MNHIYILSEITMKIALISATPKIAEKKKNIQTMKKYVTNENADLFVFPELFLTGYRGKDEYRNLAEKKEGPSIKSMQNLAQKKDCHIIFGMPLQDENVDGLIHNAAVLIHPNQQVDIYKKWFLPTFGPFEEKIFFDEGEQLNVFNTQLGKIGILICYDLYFPEICKAYSLQGADLIVCISASPNVTRKYFETLLPARAIENTMFIAYSNIVGTQEDLTFWGGSQIYSPLGELMERGKYFEEHRITAELNLSELPRARAQRPVIRDIRPQIYQDLYDFSRTHEKSKKE